MFTDDRHWNIVMFILSRRTWSSGRTCWPWCTRPAGAARYSRCPMRGCQPAGTCPGPPGPPPGGPHCPPRTCPSSRRSNQRRENGPGCSPSVRSSETPPRSPHWTEWEDQSPWELVEMDLLRTVFPNLLSNQFYLENTIINQSRMPRDIETITWYLDDFHPESPEDKWVWRCLSTLHFHWDVTKPDRYQRRFHRN